MKRIDLIRIDAAAGSLDVLVDPAEWAVREPVTADLSANRYGCGRELFEMFRRAVSSADKGACSLDVAA
jgi:phosphogluconate dehydratase